LAPVTPEFDIDVEATGPRTLSNRDNPRQPSPEPPDAGEVALLICVQN